MEQGIMMESKPQGFTEAVQAVRRGDRETARRLMRQVILENPSYAPAWLWMSGLVDDKQQQRECLERVLALDPTCQAARDGLEILKLQEMLAVTPSPPERERKQEARKLGTYLVERGFITAEQLEAALTEQTNSLGYNGLRVPLGDILIKQGWLTPQMLATALVMQQKDRLAVLNGKPPQHLGEYLVVEGVITPDELAAVLAEQARLRQSGQSLLLGELLIRSGYVTPQVLEEMLERQRDDFFSRFGD